MKENKELELENDNVLKEINNKEFNIFYQPQYEVLGDRLCVRSSEAMIRGDILQIGEQKEKTNEVGKWLIQKVVREQKEWIDTGINVKRVYVPINIEGLEDKTFSRYIKEEVNKVGLKAKYLGVSLTGVDGVKEVKKVNKGIRKVQKLGVTVAVEDESCEGLGGVEELEYDVLKIAESCVEDIHKGDNLKRVAETVKVAKKKGKEVIVSGVESEEIQDILSRLGCDIFQGILFSKEIESEKYKSMLREGIGTCFLR